MVSSRASVWAGRVRASAILVSGILLGSALASAPILAGPAAADTPATAAFASPGVCATSSPVPFTLTVTVGSLTPLRSLFVAIPSGYTAVTPESPATLVTYAGSDYLAATGLDVASGSTTISFTAVPPASGSATWIVEGETDAATAPDGDVASQNGDDILPVPQPTTTVYAGCRLVFTAEPASTALNGGSAPISSIPGGSYATPVGVQVEDGSGNPVPVATPVALTLSAHAALSGAGSTTSATGAATFDALANGESGLNLTLTAQAPGYGSAVAPATSTQFTIFDSGQTCTSGCSTSPATGFSVTAAGSGFLGASVNPFTLSCSALRFGLYPGIAGTTTLGFSYTGDGTKTVQLFVARSLLTTLKAKLLALHYLVCFTAPVPFTTIFGLKAARDPSTSALLGQDYFTGLLPDCEDAHDVPPCVSSRTWTTAGLTITIVAPAGDPFGR
jgi:hypothetical protein